MRLGGMGVCAANRRRTAASRNPAAFQGPPQAPHFDRRNSKFVLSANYLSARWSAPPQPPPGGHWCLATMIFRRMSDFLP